MRTKNNNELSNEQKSSVSKMLIDPVLFAIHILGVVLWEREAAILQSIRTHRRTAIKAAHGVGKTYSRVSDFVVVGTLFRGDRPYNLTHSEAGENPAMVGDPSSCRACEGPIPEAQHY